MKNIRDDEFNSASATRQVRENFEFGYTFAKNDHLSVEKDAAPKGELNHTNTTNDSVADTGKIQKNNKQDSVLDTIKKNQGAEKVATNTASSVSTTAVETVTALTITVVSVATGITIINTEPVSAAPDIYANIVNVRSTASYIDYNCFIEEDKDGLFAIVLTSGDYEELNEAGNGENVGRFEDLTVNRVYTLQVVTFDEETEERYVLTEKKIKTENLTVFDAFSMDMVANMSEESFHVTLDYVDDNNYYQDFALYLENEESPRNHRTIHLQKKVGTQKVYLNDGDIGSDFGLHTDETIKYKFSYVTTENGTRETVVVKEGKTAMTPDNLPEFGDVEYKPILTSNLYLPLRFKVTQGREYLNESQIVLTNKATGEKYYSGYINTPQENVYEWQLVDFSYMETAEALRTVAATGANFKLQLVVGIQQTYIYKPENPELLDFYTVPLDGFTGNDYVLFEDDVYLKATATSEIFSIKPETYITNDTICFSTVSIDENNAFQFVKYDFTVGGETYSITVSSEYMNYINLVEYGMESIIDDLVANPCDITVSLTDSPEGATWTEEIAKINNFQFKDQYEYTLNSVNFFDYGWANNMMYMQFDYVDSPEMPMAYIKILMSGRNGTISARIQPTQYKNLVMFSNIEQIDIDPTREDVTIKIFFEEFDLQAQAYNSVLKATFENVRCIEMPYVDQPEYHDPYNFYTDEQFNLSFNIYNPINPTTNEPYWSNIVATYYCPQDDVLFDMQVRQLEAGLYGISFDPVEHGINFDNFFYITLTATSTFGGEAHEEEIMYRYPVYVSRVLFLDLEVDDEIELVGEESTLHLTYHIEDYEGFFQDIVIRCVGQTSERDYTIFGTDTENLLIQYTSLGGSHTKNTTENFEIIGIDSEGNEYVLDTFSVLVK